MMKIQINGTKLIIQKNTFGSILSWFPVLFYLANLLRMTGHSSIPYLISMFVFGGIGLIYVVTNKAEIQSIYVIALLLLAASGFANYLTVGNFNITDLVNNMLLMGIAYFLLVFPLSYRNGFVAFYISIAFFIVSYLSGVGTHSLLISSGNYISVLIILSASMYYIAVDSSDKQIQIYDLIPALLCFLLSIWAKGRGGILSSLVLLSILTMYYVTKYAKTSTIKKLCIVFAVILLVSYLIIGDVNVIESFMSLGKWKNRGYDVSSRTLIWDSYVSKAKESILYILNGAPLKDIPLIYSFNNNTHNSFLQLHATNGLFVFALVVIMTIKSIIYQVKTRNMVILSLTLTLVIRGMTDKFIFGQYGMPIMVFIVLYPYFDKYRNRRQE